MTSTYQDDLWVLKWKEEGSVVKGYGYKREQEGRLVRGVVTIDIDHYMYIDTASYKALIADNNRYLHLVCDHEDAFMRALIPSNPLETHQMFTKLSFSTRGDYDLFRRVVGATFMNDDNPERKYLYETEYSDIIKTCASLGRPYLGWSSPDNPNINMARDCVCVLSFDIETLMPREEGWPKWENPEDIIFMIALSVSDPKRYKDSHKEVIVVVSDTVGQMHPVSTPGDLKPITDMCPETTVYATGSEKDLLSIFFNRVCEHEPDILTGHNIMGYDIPYINGRSSFLKMYMPPLSRYSDIWEHTKTKVRSRTVKGIERDIHRWEIDDISIIDTLLYTNQDISGLGSYKLDALAQTFLGSHKTGLTYKEMYIRYNRHTLDDIRHIVNYCSMDAELSLQLFHKLDIFETVFQKSCLTATSLEFLYTEGPIHTINNTIFKYLKKNNIVHNVKKHSKKSEPYKGGLVMLDKPGLFGYATILDFTSLYPSVMMDRNICVSTVMVNKKSIKDEECEHIDIEDDDDDGVIVKRVSYIKSSVVKGIIPAMIEEILNKRKEVQIEMKASKDDLKRIVLDKRQQALKVVANATYGCYGNPGSIIFSVECAESITAYARRTIMVAREIIHNTLYKGFKSNVIYTDTDSCLVVNEGVTDKNSSEELAKIIDVTVSKRLGTLMNLKYEDTCKKIILVAKKNYIYQTLNDKMKYKGVSVVRGNNCELLRITYKRFVEICMDNAPIEDITDELIGFITAVREHRYKPDDLVISMRLSKDVNKYEARLPIVKLVEKMSARGKDMAVGWSYESIYIKTLVGTLFGTPSYKYHKEGTSEQLILFEDYNPDKHAYDERFYLKHHLLNGILKLLDVCGKLRNFAWTKRNKDNVAQANNRVATIHNLRFTHEEYLSIKKPISSTPLKQTKLMFK